jgi:putative ABC transport system permease protein
MDDLIDQPMWDNSNATTNSNDDNNNNNNNNSSSHQSPDLVEIENLGLFYSACYFSLTIFISAWFHLGLHTKLFVAAIRCIAQLLLLGLILVPIFNINRWWLTAVYCSIMLAIAAAEAVSRAPIAYSGMLRHALVSMGLASGSTLFFGLYYVIGATPWYDAQYLIPLLGMLLGNACSGVAVGLNAVLDEFSTGRDRIELLLALGAGRMEALLHVRQRAVRTALTPLLNSMSVVGIVSIPGMMTGQILGGSDPSTAARYQIVIMFLMAAAIGLSTVGAVLMAMRTICDDAHRLRVDKLQMTESSAIGALGFVSKEVSEGWGRLKKRVRHVGARIGFAIGGRARGSGRGSWGGRRGGGGEVLPPPSSVFVSDSEPSSPMHPLLGTPRSAGGNGSDVALSSP